MLEIITKTIKSEDSNLVHINMFCSAVMCLQVQEWRETHGCDLFYFWPATQEEEVVQDDGDDGEYIVEEAEDDILYAEGGDSSTDNMTTLLFIHQWAEQLQILKRSETWSKLFTIR